MRCKDIILDYFKKHWLRYAFGVVFVILATIFNAILPQLLGKTIDLVKAARDPAQSATLRDVRNICLLMCACAVAAFLTRNIWRYLIMGFTRSARSFTSKTTPVTSSRAPSSILRPSA